MSRSKSIDKSLNMDKNLTQLVLKYDLHFNGKLINTVELKNLNLIKKFLHINNTQIAMIIHNKLDIYILDIKDSKRNFKLKGHSQELICICKISDDVIASSAADKTIIIWDLINKNKLQTIHDNNNIFKLIYMNDYLHFATVDDKLVRYNMITHTKEKINIEHDMLEILHSDSKYIIIISYSDIIYWNVKEEIGQNYKSFPNLVTRAFLLPDDKLLLFIYGEIFQLYDLKTGTILFTSAIIVDLNNCLLFSNSEVILIKRGGSFIIFNYLDYTYATLCIGRKMMASVLLINKRIITGYHRNIDIWE